MGFFSWLDCVTGKQIRIGALKNAYLLIPKEFGGGKIVEPCYDGYGNFGGHDIYNLIADWNRPMIPEILRKSAIGKWKCHISDDEKKVMMNFYDGKPLDHNCAGVAPIYLEKRYIGIVMSCYNQDNERLDYPIRLTYGPSVSYEDCKKNSPTDPYQGCC